MERFADMQSIERAIRNADTHEFLCCPPHQLHLECFRSNFAHEIKNWIKISDAASSKETIRCYVGVMNFSNWLDWN